MSKPSNPRTVDPKAESVRPDGDSSDSDDAFRRFLGIEDRFSVKSHYPQYKKNLRELQENEARLQTIIHTIPFDIFLLDKEGRCVLQNALSIRHFGDCKGKRTADLPLRSESKRFFLEMERLAAGGETVHREMEIEDRTGRRWILEVVSPIPGDDSVNGIVGVNVDISERKQAERDLQTLNEELENKVRLRTEELVNANEALRARTQSLEEALQKLRETQETLVQTRYQASVGRVIASIAHELNNPLGAILSSTRRMTGFSDELAGAFSRISRLSSPLRDLAVFLLQSAARLHLPDEDARRRLAARLSDAGCRDCSNVADDLDDMGVRDLPEDLVEAAADTDGARVVQDVWMIGSFLRSAAIAKDSAEIAAHSVQTLNAYLTAPQDSGTRMREFDLVERIRRLPETISVLPRVRIESGAPIRIRGDAERLDLVWTNLIRNAVQAAGPRGRVTVRVRMEGSRAAVDVADNGPGIAPEIRDYIFDPLFSTRGSGESKGLGLDICRRIVDTHDGEISFESEPGRTVFTVRLPTQIPPD